MTAFNNKPEHEQELAASLEKEVQAYRSDDSLIHSPIWIWFTKLGPEECYCLLCKKSLVVTHSNTSGLMRHLKRVHNAGSGYDAAIICEELAELKELRLASKRTQKDITKNKKRAFRKLLNKERKKQESVRDRATASPSSYQTSKRVKGDNDDERKIMEDLLNVEGKHEIDDLYEDDEEEEIAQGEIPFFFFWFDFSRIFFV